MNIGFKNSKKVVYFIVILFSIIFLLVIVKTFLPSLIFRVEEQLTNSVHFIGDISNYFKEKDELYRENQRLKREIQNLHIQIVNLSYLRKENEVLRSLLSFKESYTIKKWTVGKVIAYSPESMVRSFTVDVGSKDGLKSGDIVINNGYVVGMIGDVYSNFSIVIPVDDRNFKVMVRTSKTGELCFYQGFEKGKGYLKFVRPDQDVRIGDTIITDVISDNIPAGIPIGVIRNISQKEGEFFRYVEVDLFYKPTLLDYVIVVSR
ncbi:MAG: rod shape-determining protein MreC [Hydrogenothermaceae bacterium]